MARAVVFLNRPEARALWVSSTSPGLRYKMRSTVDRDSETLFLRRLRKRETFGWADTASVADMMQCTSEQLSHGRVADLDLQLILIAPHQLLFRDFFFPFS